MKFKTIKLKILNEYQDVVLTSAGYTKHNKFGHGYIKEVKKDRRFHVYPLENEIEIHADKTIKGKHVVLDWQTYVAFERRNIKRLYRKMFPELFKSKEPKLKVGRKGVFAENLLSIQKRKVIVRSAFNPLRYFVGKLKVITGS